MSTPQALLREETGARPKGGESNRSADKSRGITAKERYLREAYKEVRRSDLPC
jgi:hypothetical protein